MLIQPLPGNTISHIPAALAGESQPKPWLLPWDSSLPSAPCPALGSAAAPHLLRALAPSRQGAHPWGFGSEYFFLPFQVKMGFFEGQETRTASVVWIP